MRKDKLITIAICLAFIVFSGIFYIKSGQSGEKISLIKNSERYTDDNNITDDIYIGGTADNTINGSDDSASSRHTENYDSGIKNTAVYICGAVKHPGVYDFTDGARLCDAVKAAGGFKKSASRTSVNLARLLVDGEQIIIPTKKQAASSEKASFEAAFPDKGLVNLNTASKEELMSLSGIGESKADAIMEYRSSNRFNSIEDIMNVTGIKDGLFNQIKNNITV